MRKKNCVGGLEKMTYSLALNELNRKRKESSTGPKTMLSHIYLHCDDEYSCKYKIIIENKRLNCYGM